MEKEIRNRNRTIIYSEFHQNTPKRFKRKNKGKKIKFLVIFSLIFVVGFFVFRYKMNSSSTKTIVNNEPVKQTPSTKNPNENVLTYTVQEGDIPMEVFLEQGKFTANDTEALLTASEDVYDFTKIKVGQKIDFFFDKNTENKAKKIEYYQNTESVIVAEANEDGFEVRKEDIPYQTTQEITTVDIDEFLYKDALDAGLTEATILEIADIFSFDVDFTTEIRQGDQLKLVYEKRTLDGQPAPDGKVLAAKFTNDGQEYFGYYFESEGEGSHYDPEGKELVRQFLRAPLSYRSITSGYTGARLHPVTRKVTAHYQIDYAAPTGTPVVATARGTVTRAGWEGGWGHIVRLKHDNGYTTHYAHLNGYAKSVRSGASVSQGQVIGYVGSTGWSTGPHLDYGMKLNGSPINPLSLKLPKGIPLSGDEMKKFQEEKAKYESNLN